MECLLKASVPYVDLTVKMEALVHDLTLALEESSNGTNVRRRWGLRRRARSAGNIPSLSGNKHSDDSSSSIYDSRMTTNKTLASKYQSDSDETNKTKRFARFSNLNNGSNIESDSVNENFVPRTNIKRKRKFKRMAIDSDSNPSTSQGVALMTNSTVGKKKRIFRNDCDNRYGNIWCGKRKRSCRERSIDCEMRSVTKPSRNCKSKSRSGGKMIQSDDAMDCSRMSSSSISSSDSEAGIVTNDEDREGDDEQSDWVGESSSLWNEVESTGAARVDEKIATNPTTFQALLASHEGISFEQQQQSSEDLGAANKKNCRQTILLQFVRDASNGREIRAGRRHVDNTPGYSIITSANEKVSRFLQDPSQSELRLHPVCQPEREKLNRLANLYNLNLKGDCNCPVLYKTRETTRAICVDRSTLNRFSDYKRLRRTPPNSPNPESLILENNRLQNDEQLLLHASRDNGASLLAHTIEINNFLGQSGAHHQSPENEIQHKTKFHNFGHSKSN